MKQFLTALIICLILGIPAVWLIISIEEVPVCVDPKAQIERNRILDCHAWEDQRVVQF